MRCLLFLFALVLVGSTLVVPNGPGSFDCLICDGAVKTAEPMAEQDTETIEKAVLKDCKNDLKKIPFADYECEKFVKEKLDPIIKELKSGTAPEDICKKLKFC